MFHQVQQLAKLNASLIQRCNGAAAAAAPSILSVPCANDESSPPSQLQSFKPKRNTTELLNDDPERERLQALVVQQTHELKVLRKKLESAIPIPPGCQIEESNLTFNGRLGHLGTNPSEPQHAEGSEPSETFSYAQEQKRKRLQAHLRQLPLTSLNAQLKSKGAEVQRLQQLATKLEAQVVAIVHKKREMAREYQQITNVQQLQLKKYFALLQKLENDKRGVERKLVELGEYVVVLERKLVASVEFKDDILKAPGYTNCTGKLREPHQSHTKLTNRVYMREKTTSSTSGLILNVRAG